VAEAIRRGIPLSNDSQIFLEAAPCPAIGITGSAGKTTTTTLVGRMASASKQYALNRNQNFENNDQRSAVGGRVWVGGNIGAPLIAEVDDMGPDDLAVVELSSFQLELMTAAPQIAAVLNITPNHLDRHASLEEYTQAKARILDYQDPGVTGRECTAVLNRDDPGAWALAGKVRGRLVSFGVVDPGSSHPGTFVKAETVCLRVGRQEIALMPRSSILLRGEHNLSNVLAATAIAYAAGLPVEAMQAGVEGFTGVPHRLELVRVWEGASWYNDSIATAPERTIAAIQSFEEPLVLLAGGRDKNLAWDELAALARRRVDHLILFGEAAEKIWLALVAERQAAGEEWPYTVSRCTGLQQAVQEASRIAEPGDVVLLSPGGTSFDEFRDFEDRGEAFRKWVKQLT
jgi:UDP-N-acetylmuramoylalanine--D-glutamate ligase